MQMNEQLRQRAQEIADEHGNDAYSVALAMLKTPLKLTFEIDVDFLGKELPELVNEIKAEAVREAMDSVAWYEDRTLVMVSDVLRHANKLENQND